MQKDFSVSITVDQSAMEVFNAVNNVRGWWSQGITGNSSNLNDEFVFQYKDIHYSKQLLTEVIPGKKVVWTVTDSRLGFVSDEKEWNGTTIIFDITDIDGKTKLVFTHKGLTPAAQCYEACSPAWTEYIQYSLFNLITTGKGNPNLEGTKIEEIK